MHLSEEVARRVSFAYAKDKNDPKLMSKAIIMQSWLQEEIEHSRLLELTASLDKLLEERLVVKLLQKPLGEKRQSLEFWKKSSISFVHLGG